MSNTQFSEFSLNIDSFVLLSLYLVFGAYVIFTAVLYYHWKTYGSDAKVTSLTLILYCVTTVPLFIIASVLALTI